ncbi:MAG: choice-of-anchor D domain-containing protein, partial [bacterium]|nr:choice-of-anchor D domain-containing protein [Candidatus Kapabacteria bacterium]
LVNAASERRAAISASNLPIVTGGANSAGAAITSTEIFQPLRANDIAFAPEEIGRLSDSSVVVIENTWSLPVRVERFRIDGSAEFIVRGDTSDFILQPGASRSLRVYFQPAQAGDRSGALLFDIGSLVDTVRLTGRGLTSDISIINSPFDLGRQLINTRRIECMEVLQNNGTDPATIDSIIISPSAPFRLVSPIGRATIQPGEKLTICVEFAPSQQIPSSATASIHLASRTFPLQVLGRGIRRYAVGSTFPITCDTVTYAPGVEVPREILIENPGDEVVVITAAQIVASAPGLFRIADPSLFPVTLQPGATFRFTVIYAPSRESREIATIGVANDGDSTIAIQMCVVTRSRYLSVSQAALDFGGICLGDTAGAFINIENPGGFDSVGIVSASIAPAGELTLSGFTAQILGPREYTTLRVQAAPTVGGPFQGTLTIRSDRGDVTIPIRGTALPSAGFVVGANAVTIGQTVVLPVSIQGLTTTPAMTSATLTARYDPSLLLPLRVVALNGAPAIDAASSTITTSWGVARVDVRWPNGGPTTDGPAFGLELEVLRGDAYVANVEIEGV